MLFELCHPVFTTGMERAIVFRNLKLQKLPEKWPVMTTHPLLANLILKMLHKDASCRPDAQQVVRNILQLQAPGPLVLSLDRGNTDNNMNIVLRVEVDLLQLIQNQSNIYVNAMNNEMKLVESQLGGSLDSATSNKSNSSSSLFNNSTNVLPPLSPPPIDPSTEALQQIRSKIVTSCPSARIVQYGLRESHNNQNAVMEFLLSNLDERGSSAVSKAVTALDFVREVKLV